MDQSELKQMAGSRTQARGSTLSSSRLILLLMGIKSGCATKKMINFLASTLNLTTKNNLNA